MKQKIKRLFTIHYSLFTNNKGFTLIELAIVLIIIGILVGLGAALMGPLTKKAKLNESRDVVKAAREAVIGYAIANKKLPATIAADAGAREADAWGNLLDYRYSANLSGAGVNLCVTSPVYLGPVTDNRTSPPATLNTVVVVLLSRGENGTNNTEIPGPPVTFTINEQSSTYDDIVEYIDIAFLREKVCHAFRITTESLPTGTEEVAYPSALLASVTLEATDGTTPYAWSIVGQTQGTNGCIGTDFPIASVNIGLCMTTGGVISGTPVIDGSYNFTVQVTDSELPTTRTAKKSLTITINPNKPVITTEFLHYGQETLAYNATLSATGGKSPYSWNISSGLPPNLLLQTSGTCNSFTCTASTPCICGTPPVTTGRGTYSFTVTVTDSLLPVGRTSLPKSLSIAINPAP